MPYPFATQAQLTERIGTATVRRLFDDDDDGSADPAVLTRYLTDASSKVASYLAPVYPIESLKTSTPDEVVRITIDVAVAMASIDFPEVMRRDGDQMMRAAERDLDKVRSNKTNLGTAEHTAANEGGTYVDNAGNEATAKTFENFGQF